MADETKCGVDHDSLGDDYCYVCLRNEKVVWGNRPNLHEQVVSFVEAAGLNPSQVSCFEVTPKEVRFTVQLNHEGSAKYGLRYLCGDDLATGTLVFPCGKEKSDGG